MISGYFIHRSGTAEGAATPWIRARTVCTSCPDERGKGTTAKGKGSRRRELCVASPIDSSVVDCCTKKRTGPPVWRIPNQSTQPITVAVASLTRTQLGKLTRHDDLPREEWSGALRLITSVISISESYSKKSAVPPS